MEYSILVNDALDKPLTLIKVNSYLFETTLKGIINSLSVDDPKRITIDMIYEEKQ